MPPKKIIIDTDPGVDDIFALLLALSARSTELELLLISLTFGNIDLQSCLKNAVSLFHVLDLELAWRRSHNLAPGYPALSPAAAGAAQPPLPILALGASQPLEGQSHDLDYYHGADGLGGVHSSAPHLTPTQLWTHLFDGSATTTTTATATATAPGGAPALPRNFVPSPTPAHKEMLRLLRENEPDTITIVAVGPLTNLALAAAEDVDAFLRAREVVCMGGALDVAGNVTPLAEFNHYADAYAAARVYALTSPAPASTAPPSPRDAWPPFHPSAVARPLRLVLLPLDVTTRHVLSAAAAEQTLAPLKARGSPLAEWAHVFLSATFAHQKSVYKYTGDDAEAAARDVEIALHDPLCVWWVLMRDEDGWLVDRARDVRVEPAGQWTRGMCVVDRRKKRVVEADAAVLKHDRGLWLHRGFGNRVDVVKDSPDRELFTKELLRRVFAC